MDGPKLYRELATGGRSWSGAGFQPKVLPFDHSELPPGRYQLFVAARL